MTTEKERARARGLAGRALFSLALRARRQAADLSQDALGRRAGADRQAVNRAENQAVGPTVDQVYQLADALGCTPGDLLPPLPAPEEGA